MFGKKKRKNQDPKNGPENKKKGADFGIEPLEKRVLLSASWVDADTGESQDGPTNGDDIFNGADLLSGDAGTDIFADGGAANEGDDGSQDSSSDESSDSSKDSSGDKSADKYVNDVDGKDGDDILYGGDGADKLKGGSGLDYLVGDAGDDKLEGGKDNDILYGGDGSDELKGGSGLDYLLGDAGDDKLKGEKGDDNLKGGEGNDELDGGSGLDYLAGEAGDDDIDAGKGDDVIVYTVGDGSDVIDGDKGDDTLIIRGVSGTDAHVLIEDGDTYSSRTGEDVNDDRVVVSINGEKAIEAKKIEALKFFKANPGDTIEISGSLSDTSLDADDVDTVDAFSSAAIQAQNPSHHWLATEGGFHDSVGSAHGEYHGSSTDNGAGGVVFDGNDHVVIEHADDMLVDQGTVHLSFNADSVSGTQGLFSKDSTHFDDGGHLTVWVKNGEVEVRIQSTDQSYTLRSDVDLVAGQEYDVDISFGDDGFKLFVNGELADSDSYTGGLGTSSGGSGNAEPIVLGANAWQSGDEAANNLKDYFSGTISDVAIFGEQLDADEISAIHDSSDVEVAEENDALTGTDGDDVIYAGDAEAGTADLGGVLDAESTVSHWRFDAGGVVDTVSSHDGGYSNGASGGEGGVEGEARAAHFDGGNDYVEIPHHSDFETDNGTIQMWINPDDTSGTQTLVSKDSSGYDDGGHLTMRMHGDDVEVRFQSDDSSYTIRANNVVSSGEWNHVAFSFGDDGMKLFVNGELVDSDSYTGGMGSTSGGSGNEEPWVLGANQWSSGNQVANSLKEYFGGKMDHVAFSSDALSADDIQTIYNTGLGNVSGGPEADAVSGGGGYDTVNYRDAGAGVNIDLTSGTATGDTEADSLDSIEAAVGSDHDDTFSFETAEDGARYTVDGADGQDSIDLSGYSSDNVTFEQGQLTVETGTGSFVIEYSNIESIQFGDAGAIVTDGDVSGQSFDSKTLVVDGADVVSVDPGAVSASFDYEVDTNTISVSMSGSGSNGADLNIETVGGDITIGSVEVDADVDSITTDSDIESLTVTSGSELPVVTVDGGDGAIGSLNLGDGSSYSGGDVVVNANVTSLEMGGLHSDITINGDVGSVASNGAMQSSSSLSIEGSTGAVTVSGDMKGDISVSGGMDSLHASDDIEGGVTVGGDVGSIEAGDDIKSGSQISISGNVESITVGDVINSATIEIDGDLNSVDAPNGIHGGATIEVHAVTGQFDLVDGSHSENEDFGSGADIHYDGNSNTLTVVSTVNSAPTDIDFTGGSVAENAAVGTQVASVSVTDVDADDTHSFELMDDAGGRFEIDADGNITVAEGADLDHESAGAHEVTVRVTDSGGETYEESLTITVGDVNEGPTSIDLDGSSVQEGVPGAVIGQLGVVDPDADDDAGYAVSDSRFEVTADGVLKLRDGVSLDHETTSSVDVEIIGSDSAGNTIDGVFTINVQDVNEGPSDLSFTGGTVSENAAGGTFVASASVTDVDEGDTHSFELTDDAGGRFEIDSDGNITVADGADLDHESADAHEVTVRVTDSGGATYEESVTITVGDVNEGPSDISFTGGSVDENAAAGTPVASVSVTDVDEGDSHSFELTDNAGGRFEIDSDGNITVAEGAVLDHESAGAHEVTVRVTDSGGATYEESLTITVGDVNEGPSDISFTGGSVDENAAAGTPVASVSVTDVDDGDSHSFELTDDAGGRFEIDSDGNITVADGADLDHESADAHEVTVRVTDSSGATYEESVTITVGDVNEAPSDISFTGGSVDENAAVGTQVASVSVADVDAGDSHSFELTDDAGGRFAIDSDGTITVADGAALDHESAGAHEVTVRVTDSGGATYEESLTITVGDVNEAPSDISFTGGSVDENAAVGTPVASVSVTDVDDGDSHSFELTDDAGGRFEIDSDGNITVADGADLDHESAGAHEVTVRVTDSGGATYEESVTITVGDVNEGPSDLSFTGGTVSENAAGGTFVASASVTDVDEGDTHSFELTDDAGGRFEIDSDGNITVAEGADLNFEASESHEVTVRVTDEAGESYEEVIDITVANVEETYVLSGNSTLSAADGPFENVVINGGYMEIDGDAEIKGDLTIESVARINGGEISVSGDVTTSDTSYHGSATIVLDGDGAQTISTGGGAGELHHVSIENTSGEVSIEGELQISGSYADNGNTVDATDADVELQGNSSVSGSGTTFGDVTINGGYMDITEMDVDGDLTIESVARINGGEISVSGDVTTSDTSYHGSATIVLDGDGAQTISTGGGAGELHHVSIENTSGEVSIEGELQISGSYSDNGNTVDATDADVEIQGNATVSGSGTTFGDVTLNGGYMEIEGDMYVQGDLEIANAARINGGVIYVAGDVTDTDGNWHGSVEIRPWITNEAPTDITLDNATVNENAGSGTPVGTIQVSDTDDGDTHSFELTDDAGGRFSIDSDGNITVAEGASLDHESADSHEITVRVTDAEGEFIEETIAINVGDVDEAPVLDAEDITVNDGEMVTLSVNARTTDGVDFDSVDIDSYGGSSQDVSLTVETDGDTLSMSGNGWKSIDYDYTVTEDTILEFQFKSAGEGEIHGIGFDTDGSIDASKTFRLHGTQDWGIDMSSDYEGNEGEWVTYQIRVGDHFQGDFDRMFFVNDHDGGSQDGESAFRGVRVYEEGSAQISADDLEYTWEQVSGPTVVLDDPNAVTPTFESPAVDVDTDIVFRVTVANGDEVSTEEVTVHVVSVNDVPEIDAGEDLFVNENTPVTLGVEVTEGPTSVDFDSVDIDSYGGSSQDVSLTVETDGDTLSMSGNGWKSIDYDYTVTEDTILEFQFKSAGEGEIHGIGFDTDGSIDASKTFRLHGTQDWGIDMSSDYEGNEGEWVTYQIRVGDHFQGDFDRMFFVNDHDGGSQDGESAFRGVRVYEEGSAQISADDLEYTWEQVSGPAVVLDDASATSPTFDSPAVDSDTELVFKVTVRDGEDFRTDEVTVHVAPVNDAPTDISFTGGGVAENAAAGTQVASASVADVDAIDTHSFELTDDAGGRFAIDSEGNITVADGAALDHESAGEHEVTVRVTDSGGETYEESLTITVGDVNEGPSDISFTGGSVAENAAAGTQVASASVADVDAIDTHSFELTDDAGGRFAIDSEGNITVADGAALDHESAGEHEVTVRVTDSGGVTHEESLTITVGDVNEGPSDISFTGGSVAENAAAGTQVASASVADVDAIDTHSFELTDDAGGRFAIDSEGNITVADGAALDHESAGEHEVTVRVTDSGGVTHEESLTITVGDVNEGPSDIRFTGGSVAENAVAGTQVASVSVADVDAGDSHSFELTDDAGGRFVIDSDGNITVADGAALDHESAGEHEVTVRVTDSGGATHEESLTITVGDVNEGPSSIEITEAKVEENSLPGTVVASVAVTDVDAGETFTYALTDDAGGRFIINAEGDIVVADGADIDYEFHDSHTVTVLVTDSAGHTVEQAVRIEVTNVTEPEPESENEADPKGAAKAGQAQVSEPAVYQASDSNAHGVHEEAEPTSDSEPRAEHDASLGMDVSKSDQTLKWVAEEIREITEIARSVEAADIPLPDNTESWGEASFEEAFVPESSDSKLDPVSGIPDQSTEAERAGSDGFLSKFWVLLRAGLGTTNRVDDTGTAGGSADARSGLFRGRRK
ncbi:MAG: hypothetical protein ED559_07920 [Phycisphaera sp.]|nr:MAG: hypothetical protein ED559_07920 [Phycisphaera sp.]